MIRFDGDTSGSLLWLPSDETPLSMAASVYAAHGLAAFPCSGKVPLTAHGCLDATTDATQIAAWWRRRPNASIGWALPPGFVVLDVDGPTGAATLNAVERPHGGLPATLRATTGGGGEHWIFTLPMGAIVKNRVRFAAGLDLRAAGGYIVVAPSLHASGRRYRWAGRVAPVEAPAWLLSLVADKPPPTRAPYFPTTTITALSTRRRQRYARATLRRLAAEVAAAVEGSRNATLNRAWFRLAGFRDVLDREAVRVELLAAARACGLDEREAERVLR